MEKNECRKLTFFWCFTFCETVVVYLWKESKENSCKSFCTVIHRLRTIKQLLIGAGQRTNLLTISSFTPHPHPTPNPTQCTVKPVYNDFLILKNPDSVKLHQQLLPYFDLTNPFNLLNLICEKKKFWRKCYLSQ